MKRDINLYANAGNPTNVFHKNYGGPEIQMIQWKTKTILIPDETILKALDTDEERYKFVRKCWKTHQRFP